MKFENVEEFKRILADLRMLPENADYITAYGNGNNHPELDGLYPLGEFAEAIYDEELDNLKIDIVNAFHQLYSMDFQNSYEGISTFYENFYNSNRKEDVERAAEWFISCGMTDIGKMMILGYESKEKEKVVARWIDGNASTIYSAYRKIMFEFEDRYLNS